MTLERIEIGKVGVNTGQLLLSDPRVVLAGQLPSFEEICGLKPSSRVVPSLVYKGEPIAAAIKDQKGRIGAGVTFSSGFGDGIYPVYATVVEFPRWGKRIVKIEIEFLTDQIRQNLKTMGFTLELPRIKGEMESSK